MVDEEEDEMQVEAEGEAAMSEVFDITLLLLLLAFLNKGKAGLGVKASLHGTKTIHMKYIRSQLRNHDDPIASLLRVMVSYSHALLNDRQINNIRRA